jgi:YfiH family protein
LLQRVDLGPGVIAGFTSRSGGVSADPYGELNLAEHVGDDPEAVRRNRDRLAADVGDEVVFMRQVHGRRIRMIFSGQPAVSDSPDGPGHDSLIIGERGASAVAVLVADCVPVLLADPEAGVAAAVHAGRQGLLGGVLQDTVRLLTAGGNPPERLRAVLGPAAGPCCYEVPAAMREDAAARLPAVRASTRAGTPSIDLRAGCEQALRAEGVVQVSTVGGCTIEDPARYSYRRAATTGRFAGVIRLPA